MLAISNIVAQFGRHYVFYLEAESQGFILRWFGRSDIGEHPKKLKIVGVLVSSALAREK